MAVRCAGLVVPKSAFYAAALYFRGSVHRTVRYLLPFLTQQWAEGRAVAVLCYGGYWSDHAERTANSVWHSAPACVLYADLCADWTVDGSDPSKCLLCDVSSLAAVGAAYRAAQSIALVFWRSLVGTFLSRLFPDFSVDIFLFGRGKSRRKAEKLAVCTP